MQRVTLRRFLLVAAIATLGLSSIFTPTINAYRVGLADAACLTDDPIQSDKPATAFKVEDLAWISGDWETAPGGRMEIDEHWTRVSGGSLIGMSRTVAGGKTVFFEYLRIETRGTDIFYVAHPKARTPGTDFKLVKLKGEEATFENLSHDFPKRILYRKNADGSLTARIEGDGTEKQKPQDFQYRPASKGH